jgi:hypothetical protein
MERVRLTTGRVGLGKDGVPWDQQAGQVIEVAAVEAAALVAAGQAEPGAKKPGKPPERR